MTYLVFAKSMASSKLLIECIKSTGSLTFKSSSLLFLVNVSNITPDFVMLLPLVNDRNGCFSPRQHHSDGILGQVFL